MSMQKIYRIIGASAAGIAAAKKIRLLDQNARIVCYTDEQEDSYNKCFLADWLSQQKSASELHLHDADFYQKNKIECVYARVVKLDLQEKKIQLHDGSWHVYDRLLCAYGARPRRLSDDSLVNVLPFYTFKQTAVIKDWIAEKNYKKFILLGGGISGIECADALRMQVVAVTVVERAPHILGSLVTPEIAQFIAQRASGYGVTCVVNQSIKQIKNNDDVQKTVVVDTAVQHYQADAALFTMGSEVDCSLAHDAGIVCKEGAIATNQYLQTNNEHVFAAGDCALVYNQLLEKETRSYLWADAMLQGSIAGVNMVEVQKEYSGIIPLTTSHFFDYQFVSCNAGALKNSAYVCDLVTTDSGLSAIAYDRQGIVQGFVLYGKEISYSKLKRSLVTKTALTSL